MVTSTTAPAPDSIPIDVRASVANSLKGVFGLFLKDLSALPDDAFNRSFGGKTRTVADIVHEVNVVQDEIRLTIRGEDLLDSPKGWITAPETLRTKETVIASFEKSSTLFLEMVNSLQYEDLERKIVNEGFRADRTKCVGRRPDTDISHNCE